MNPSLSSTSPKTIRDSTCFDEESESSKRLKHDVFINYSFEDIGKTFISHLRGALIRNSFAISDHTMLPVGQNTRLQLLKAIEESEMYVVVFSPEYASSVRSLDELVDIMDCFNKFDERKVVPVFYKVEPSDVRNQQGPFMEPFQAHHTNTNLHPHRVLKWRKALKDVGRLSGFTLQIGDEAEFVSKVVEELEKIQSPSDLHVTDHGVGIQSRAEELISTLRLDQNERVLVVAVFGIGGIGKTSIVKEVFNRIAPSFDLSCFLVDIHDICLASNWKVELPKELISCLTRENKFLIMSNHNEGITKIRRLVSRRKVLLVLDDVDNFQQLESLGVHPKWFYKGSRIIVTTRDRGSLGDIPYASYHTKLLNRRESLNLFTRLMFERDDPVNTKFIQEIAGRAGGLPLVLKVWSRHFKQFDKEKWASILETLKGIPHGDVQKQLQMSYDSLTPRLKKLFLDFAFFFDNEKKDVVVKVLEDEDLRFFPNNEIQYLVDKSFVEIKPDEGFRLHRAIKEMGHEIVRQENEDEPGQRTRLWDPRDVKRVLIECSGTESVESITMTLSKDMLEAFPDAFRKMRNLRLIRVYTDRLSIDWDISHDQMTQYSFKKLKYMAWYMFPYKSLDSFDIGNVVVLKLTGSNMETLWEGVKSLKKLRILDVRYSRSLTKTGNLRGLENLEELYLSECMLYSYSSICYLQKLAILDLRSTPFWKTPWEMIGKLASLRQLMFGDIGVYESYDMQPDHVEIDKPLQYLKECPITTLKLYRCKLSGGVVSLAWLKHLHLQNCSFSSHSDALLQLNQLNTIEFEYCFLMQSIPNLPANVTSVIAKTCTSLVNFPCNISELKSLTLLSFSNCRDLGTEDPYFLMKVTGLTNLSVLRMDGCYVSQVPSEIGNLVSLKELDLSFNPLISSLPDTLSNLSQLLYLNISNCHRLRLLPLLPSNLRNIDARGCSSLDVMSSTSIRTKVSKESPFRNRLMIRSSEKKEEVPDWCTYQNTGHILSFVVPLHLHSNICGIFVCSNTSYCDNNIIIPKMYNKTKNTSHAFNTENKGGHFQTEEDACMLIMSYPLDDTTVVVEPGDSVVLKLPQGSVLSCGLRLIYESDVVDSKLVFQTVT